LQVLYPLFRIGDDMGAESNPVAALARAGWLAASKRRSLSEYQIRLEKITPAKKYQREWGLRTRDQFRGGQPLGGLQKSVGPAGRRHAVDFSLVPLAFPGIKQHSNVLIEALHLDFRQTAELRIELTIGMQQASQALVCLADFLCGGGSGQAEFFEAIHSLRMVRFLVGIVNGGKCCPRDCGKMPQPTAGHCRSHFGLYRTVHFARNVS